MFPVIDFEHTGQLVAGLPERALRLPWLQMPLLFFESHTANDAHAACKSLGSLRAGALTAAVLWKPRVAAAGGQ